MSATWSRRGSALAMVFCVSVPSAWAELITPNSIPNPPSAVSSSNGTPVYPGSLITSQYKGVGVNFSSGAAITNVNGVNVWAPTTILAAPGGSIAGGPPPTFPVAQINYYGNWSGVNFVQPGTLKPTVATSLSVEIMGRQNVGLWVTYANTKVPVAIPASVGIASEPNGGVLYTFQPGPGITSFSVFAPVLDPLPGIHSAAPVNLTWGVAEISATFASVPEPASLLLAGLGVVGLAARLGWRHRRQPDARS